MTVNFPIERGSQRAVISVAIVFTVLAITACGLRVLARRVANRTLDSSDWCIFAACQSINVTSVFICGVGFHFSEILATYGMEPITLFMKFLIAIQLLWALSLSLCKISILIMYCTIFSMRPFVWTARITAVIIVMWVLATTLMGFFMCRPFEFNWIPTLPDGRWGNQVLSYQVTGAMNLVTGLVVLVLPMQYLYGLNLALYKKIVLMVSFAVGIFTCIVSVLRLVVLSSIDYSNITFNVPEPLIFSDLEPCLAVNLACVPILQPLARFGTSSRGVSTSGIGSGNVSSRRTSNFKQLSDDSSEHQLSFVGTRHVAEARAQHSRGSHVSSSDVDERIDGKVGAVVVKQEWRVITGDV
ncbi:hypothetical protein GE09DRAFT_1226482 [Coniochaeta sp. 2T2.1]|nr:hypothetical protein GE09DRAFT_1226482 [Coniochaeta sp. 2T2.1]